MSKGYLNGYGGKREDGETIAESGLRETSEESGGVRINPHSLRKTCVLTCHSDVKIVGLSRPEARILDVHVYVATDWVGEPKETEPFEKAVRFDIDNLPIDRMMSNNRYWLAKALKATQPFTAEIWYETLQGEQTVPERFVLHQRPNQTLLDLP